MTSEMYLQKKKLPNREKNNEMQLFEYKYFYDQVKTILREKDLTSEKHNFISCAAGLKEWYSLWRLQYNSPKGLIF